MSASTPQDIENPIGHKVIERSHHRPLIEHLERVYDARTVQHIAESHGLAVIQTSLSETLRNAGLLYLRYGSSSSATAQDLAPKFRTVARTAEISRNLSAELENLDFWDCWQIFQHLHSTGHPITDQLDNSTTTNPLLAGNLIVEEIQLLLNGIARFESDFFDVLGNNTDRKVDLGLYFFVEVVGTVWQSVTGKRVLERASKRNTQEGERTETSREALAFLSDSIKPLATVADEDLLAVIQSAFGRP